MITIAAVLAAAVAAGAWAQRRRGDRALALSKRLLAVMLYVLFPPVVFFNLVHLELTADIGAGLGLAWAAVLMVGVLAHQLATRALRLDRPSTGALVNAALHPNTGYLGIPVSAAVLGEDAVDQAVIYDVLVGSPTLLLCVFAVGAIYGTSAGTSVRERVTAFVTRNPPLLAAVAGLLAPSSFAPDALVDASRVLVFLLLPVGFFALGITLAAERATARIDRPLATVLALRLVVAPALLLAIAAPLIDLPDAYLIAAAMPTGLNGLVVAHAYGLAVPLAAKAIGYGTGIVVVTSVAISLLVG